MDSDTESLYAWLCRLVSDGPLFQMFLPLQDFFYKLPIIPHLGALPNLTDSSFSISQTSKLYPFPSEIYNRQSLFCNTCENRCIFHVLDHIAGWRIPHLFPVKWGTLARERSWNVIYQISFMMSVSKKPLEDVPTCCRISSTCFNRS